MPARPKPTIYEQVVQVTHAYLGPAADRFIARQVENHLKKPPEKLTKSDLLKLIDWIRVVVSLISDDPIIVEEYISELKKIAVNSNGKRVV